MAKFELFSGFAFTWILCLTLAGMIAIALNSLKHSPRKNGLDKEWNVHLVC